jgi:formiminoglutamase
MTFFPLFNRMLSKNNNFELIKLTEQAIISFSSTRLGEVRLGQSFLAANDTSKAKYIILGISESVGPMANAGLPGAENAFFSFLSAFLNTQDFDHNTACMGYIKWLGQAPNASQLSMYVSELDEFVLQCLTQGVDKHQIPIVIGGGHNNALPLIRWANLHFNKINVLNIDAHADCRAIEGRHSGNSFSYAIKEGLINTYHVFGLHRAYLNSESHQFMNDNHVEYTFYEDYLDGRRDFITDINQYIDNQDEGSAFGLEIDMDCIADMPSSALSPSGWCFDDIRRVVRKVSNSKRKVAYFHLTEAAPISDLEKKRVGKALSYLLRDFI